MGRCGGGGAGAWRERICCQEQMLNFLPFLFPEIRAAARGLAGRRSWGRERWWVLSGGSPFTVWTISTIWQYLSARGKMTPSLLCIVLGLWLSWLYKSLPSIPCARVIFSYYPTLNILTTLQWHLWIWPLMAQCNGFNTTFENVFSI